MRSGTAAAALLLVTIACDREPQVTREPPPRHPPSSRQEPAVQPTLERRLRMHDRYESVERMRASIEGGDLATARSAAASFTLPVMADLPAAAQHHGDAVPERARAIVSAPGPGAAASAFAALLMECGGCHVAAGVEWEPIAGPIPTGQDLAERMQQHAWASEAMWEAILLGRPEPFDRAAEVLAQAPLSGETPPDSERPEGVRAIEERLQAAAIANRTATRMEDRARTYAAVLATCAGCHGATGTAGPRGIPR